MHFFTVAEGVNSSSYHTGYSSYRDVIRTLAGWTVLNTAHRDAVDNLLFETCSQTTTVNCMTVCDTDTNSNYGTVKH